MQLPLEISFRNMDASEAVEERVRTLAAKLDRYFDRVMSCRVVVEASHKHHHKGGTYHVRIDMTVPGAELVISRDSHQDRSHEDVYVAVRDAFQAAYRKLEAHAAKQSGKVKTHEEPPSGRIVFLSENEGHGRIETPDGREIVFHKRSVQGAEFGKMKTGDRVRFAELDGDEGPEASSVRLV